jgi:hypothetical protein
MKRKSGKPLLNFPVKLVADDLFRLAVVIPLAWFVLHVGYNADVSFYRGPNVVWYDGAASLQRIETGLAGDP